MSLKFEELNFEITKTQWEIEKKNVTYRIFIHKPHFLLLGNLLNTSRHVANHTPIKIKPFMDSESQLTTFYETIFFQTLEHRKQVPL